MLNAVAKPQKRNMCTCSTAGTGPGPSQHQWCSCQEHGHSANRQTFSNIGSLFDTCHRLCHATAAPLHKSGAPTRCITPPGKSMALPATYPLFSTSDSSHHHDTHDEQYAVFWQDQNTNHDPLLALCNCAAHDSAAAGHCITMHHVCVLQESGRAFLQAQI